MTTRVVIASDNIILLRRLRWCTQRSREIVSLARHCGTDYDPAVLKPTPLPRGAEVHKSCCFRHGGRMASAACNWRTCTGQQV